MNMAVHLRHEVYQASGADWLGDIPSGWAVKKMKYLFRDHSQKGRPNAELLSVTQNQGVVPRSWVENRMVMPTGGLDTFKFIEKGDFAISLRSFEGGLEYCHHDGIISPAYTVLKSWHPDLEPGYYRHLFKSGAFISELQTSVVGIREGKNISFAELSHSRMPIPPLPEQRAIAAFLDEKCAKVDEAVRIKEEQIARLRERRQILIQQAVTRGLNPSAPMKDSGIDWIGQIPAHWEVRRNYVLFRELKISGHADLPVLSVSIHSGVSSEELSDEENIRSIIKIEDRTSYKEVKPGDVAYNMMRAWQGGIGAVSVHGMVSPAYVVARPSPELAADYFELLYRCPAFIRQMDSGSKGITDFRKRLYWDDFKNLLTLVPPREEQAEIVLHIAELSKKIEDAVAIKEDQIAALKEYKTGLINAAVTGKIKVA